MASETLRPDGELSDSGLVTNSELDHDDDPDVSSATVNATGNNTNTEWGGTFPTPSATPTVGAGVQEFRVGVEEFDNGQSRTPEARIELWENGSLVRAGSATPVNAYAVLAFTWNANELSTADGSLVECKLIGLATGGGPSARNTIRIGHMEWNAVVDTVGPTIVVPLGSFLLSKLLPGASSGASADVPIKNFNLTKVTPVVGTGVDIVAPNPKNYNLTGQLPVVGTSVLITIPVPKAYSLTGFLPTIAIIIPPPAVGTIAELSISEGAISGAIIAISTGVTIDVPLKTFTRVGFDPSINIGVNVNAPLGGFNRTGFIPSIQTGVTITVPAPRTYSLAGFDPLIAIGVNIPVPAPKGYSLTGFDPEVASGVNIFAPVPKSYTRTGFIPAISTIGAVEVTVPLGAFNLTKFIPNVGTGVIIITPLGTFTLTKFDPSINIGVNIIASLKTFTRTGFEPGVGTGLIIQVPSPKTFTLSNFAPDVASGVGVVVPLKIFTRTDFIPQIDTGVNIIIPSFGTFTITGFEPAVEKVIEIRVELKQFDFAGFVPIIHSNRPPLLAANILDLTPPFDDITQMRYLFRNFAVIRDLLASGVDGQFTTNDGKTVLVRGGIIVDLY